MAWLHGPSPTTNHANKPKRGLRFVGAVAVAVAQNAEHRRWLRTCISAVDVAEQTATRFTDASLDLRMDLVRALSMHVSMHGQICFCRVQTQDEKRVRGDRPVFCGLVGALAGVLTGALTSGLISTFIDPSTSENGRREKDQTSV